jgi:hypothetical protein
MILAFIDSKSMVYTHIAARGVSINGSYIVKVLGLFMKQLKKKCPAMVAQQWWFQWDNAYSSGGPGVAGHPQLLGDPLLAIFA